MRNRSAARGITRRKVLTSRRSAARRSTGDSGVAAVIVQSNSCSTAAGSARWWSNADDEEQMRQPSAKAVIGGSRQSGVKGMVAVGIAGRLCCAGSVGVCPDRPLIRVSSCRLSGRGRWKTSTSVFNPAPEYVAVSPALTSA